MQPLKSPPGTGNTSTVAEVTLDAAMERKIRQAAQKAGDWTIERDRLIIEAYESGAALREIARAAGMTHPGIRRIVHRDTDPNRRAK